MTSLPSSAKKCSCFTLKNEIFQDNIIRVLFINIRSSGITSFVFYHSFCIYSFYVWSVIFMKMKVCKAHDCENVFPNSPHSKLFCSARCRYRYNKQKLYDKRRSLSLCVQCGKVPVDLSIHTYCDDCFLYFRNRYLQQK